MKSYFLIFCALLTSANIARADTMETMRMHDKSLSKVLVEAARDGSFIDLGDEELDFIEVYVQHVATFKESGAEFEASQTSFQQFLKGAASRNAILNASAKFRKWMGIHDEEQERPIRGRESIGAR